MSSDLQSKTTTQTSPLTVPLEKVVEEVLRDSREQPEQYLDETVVPHGGE